MKRWILRFLALTAASLGILATPLCAIEKPAHTSLLKDGKFELRQYEALPVAATPMKGMQEDNQSFMRLFRYISKNNQAQQKIAMTAPVIMSDGDGDKPGAMRFVIPAEVAKAGAPAANDNQVTVTSIKGGTFAVLRFKNGDRAENRKQAIADLDAKIKQLGHTPKGKPLFAFYDPPYKPNILSTFEVWRRIELKK